MTARERTQRRRAKVRRLAAEGHGVREIARMLNVDPSTVSRDLKVPAPDGPPHPPKGGQRNRRHGAYSEAAIAPVREQLAIRLAAQFPWISPDEITIQAQRLAQMELVGQFTDDNGVVRDDAGRVWDAADKLTSWARAAEAFYERARKAQPVGWRAADDPAEREAARINASDPVALELARALAGKSHAEILDDPELTETSRAFLRHLAARDAGTEAPRGRGRGRSHKRRGEPAPATDAAALEGEPQRQLGSGAPLPGDILDGLGDLR